MIIFGVDMSSSPHIDNKKKDFLILGKGPTQGLEHTLTAEILYLVHTTSWSVCGTLLLVHQKNPEELVLVVR